MRFSLQQIYNPIQKYLNWEGLLENGFFTFYDKENKESVKYELTEFIILKLGYTVKGYNKKKGKGAYSNEVENMSEPLTVKYFDNEIIAEGLYREFKERLPLGVSLHLAITVLHNGEVVEFFLKGNNFWNFNELLKTVNIQKNKIKYNGMEKHPEAKIPFTEPLFCIGSEITEKEKEEAIENDKNLFKYDKSKKQQQEEETDEDFENEEKEQGRVTIEEVPF